MLSILADRTYRHLFLARIVVLLGAGLTTIALGLAGENGPPPRIGLPQTWSNLTQWADQFGGRTTRDGRCQTGSREKSVTRLLRPGGSLRWCEINGHGTKFRHHSNSGFAAWRRSRHGGFGVPSGIRSTESGTGLSRQVSPHLQAMQRFRRLPCADLCAKPWRACSAFPAAQAEESQQSD